ncbi:DEAD/DEAH box helicase [Streptomyces viridosporus]|uniref:DEAD/DEAH box helicase n=1 Tax=Streptomyces viridosporus TaxID=67581 RepID=UPI00332C544A
MRLYRHQERMLMDTSEPGRNAVVTAGTGSGKTEAFMLPVIADLIRESRRWDGGRAPFEPWWRSGSAPFSSQRMGEHGYRPQAVRALILYPMNALVDDQLVRLRRTLDSPGARAWLDGNRCGHRFYFGRFTGATPVTGARPDPSKAGSSYPSLDELRRHLNNTEKRHTRAAKIDETQGDGLGRQFFVPSLDGAEMRSRWDMYDAPPDILITNYSMLNVMLQRSRDRGFFDSTAEWLRNTRDARFTLIVDELHMYRGTAGTEVAYLIRNLKERLGLTDSPEKLRILAASASLDEERTKDRQFLQEFFAVNKDAFAFIPGLPAPRPTGSPAIPHAAKKLAEAAERDMTPEEADELLAETGADDAITKALGGDGTVVSPPSRPAADLAADLFPDSTSEVALAALRGVTTAIRTAAVTRTDADEDKHPRPQLRIHLFFRNVAGIWACTDPHCSCVQVEHASPTRRIGRLYTVPRSTCDCGARVLELVYCLACGEAMLGGYAPRNAFGTTSFDSYLLPDSPDLSRVPDSSSSDRTADNYLVYWPTGQGQKADDDGKWTSSDVTFAFRRSRLDSHSGKLSNDSDNWTGWSFHVRSSNKQGTKQPKASTSHIPAFPTRCPCCGADWERNWNSAKKMPLPPLDPGRFVSPIRGMRTGFEKINQLLADELAEQFSGRRDRKLLVFTDSRRDAAKLAPGIALRHYQDLVRLATLDELDRVGISPDDLAAVRTIVQGNRSSAAMEAASRLQEANPAAANELLVALTLGNEDAARQAEARLTAVPSLRDLVRTHVHARLLRLGVNPAGTTPKAQRHGAIEWYTTYDWKPDQPKLKDHVSEADVAAAYSEEGLLGNALESLFSGGGRDVESIGLGYVSALNPGQDPDGLGQASLRVLAGLRRFSTLDRDPRSKAPAGLAAYWKAVAAHRGSGWDQDRVQQKTEEAWGDSVREYLIDPAKICIRQPGPTMKVCPACGCRHLTDAAGTCTRCYAVLPGETVKADRAWDDDYYAWKAHGRRGEFPMNTAELTGQTGRTEAQTRQARFQGVFLNDEEPRVHELDLLSVTTTMEAGVDIGPLSAVVMANMPPSRFNYQQRVGRAGRRSSPVAVALTVCRGRSHDEHYFAHPDKITNEPTQPPYLALDRKEIFQRALKAEALRLAYDSLPGAGGTSNPHGEFGLCDAWPTEEDQVCSWLNDHPDKLSSAARALATYTPFTEDVVPDSAWIQHLMEQIRTVAARPTGAQELSERLAHAGVLPMFGFPTRVRHLYLERPKASYPWPPKVVIDRDISIAVSEFAPGAESIRDGEIYLSVGITEFESRPGKQPRYIDEPLENQEFVGLCKTCNSVDTAPANSVNCPVCDSRDYAIVDLREPAGFQARYDRDFNGNFAWSPRTVTSRASVNLGDLEQSVWNEADVFAGSAMRYVVNDNGGRLFSFRRAASNWGGYIATSLVDRDKDRAASGEPFKVALGARLKTDFMFVGPHATTDPMRGLRLNLPPAVDLRAQALNEGRRAAWYSLAHLLRAAAALHLDIDRRELIAGVHAGPHTDGPALYAFLADSLENGAGFSTHLGSESGLTPFMGRVEELLEDLHEPRHADRCRSSCDRCLRDYSNMAVHPLLDWCLAAHLLAVLGGDSLPDDTDRGARSLSSLRAIYKKTGEMVQAPLPMLCLSRSRKQWAVIAKHPLESSERGLESPRLRDTFDVALQRTGDASRVVVADWFTLERSPVPVLDCFQDPRRR